ncbi:MAG: PD-(D/E)XK nuclease family protein [bacterium]|nr:PD-(D/E)XK nuclease family protein [bacterium]
MNLTWLDKLFDDLPEVPKQRKNLIEISGFPRWENVISNFLAFYFDKEEEHGFSTLFLESLLKVYERKLGADVKILQKALDRPDAPGNLQKVHKHKKAQQAGFSILKEEIQSAEYTVEREQTTENGKRIDILIQDNTPEVEEGKDTESQSSWAVIIENKVYAPLYNDLQEYWNDVQAEKKIGIILSISGADVTTKPPPDGCYVSILHKELIDEVVQNLHGSFLESDDRHLLFLKEYIANINAFYMSTDYTKVREDLLEIFQSKEDEIRDLKKKDKELLEYASKSVYDAMESCGYAPSSRKAHKYRHFYFSPSGGKLLDGVEPEVASRFRFWVNIDHVVFRPKVEVYMELFTPQNTQYGDQLKNRLKEKGILAASDPIVKEGPGGGAGKSFYHIYQIHLDLKNAGGVSLRDRFANAINAAFFKHEKQYFQEALNALKGVMAEKE